jgi:uncharacterized protein YjbI with pentapeptide repeats
VKLTDATLTDVDLTLADLPDADLTGADLTGAKWREDRPTPEGWVQDPASGRLRRSNSAADDS